MGIEIARRAQGAFDDFAVKIGDDEVCGGELGVFNAAGLDHDQGFGAGAVDSAGVAEGVGSEAAAGDLLVGIEDFLAEMSKQHGVFLDQIRSLLATDGVEVGRPGRCDRGRDGQACGRHYRRPVRRWVQDHLLRRWQRAERGLRQRPAWLRIRFGW